MPAEITTVNLLEHDTLEDSPLGRIVTWSTTYGRYIMITTEIIVLLAFISRFSLDRKRADLNDAIDSKRAIIEANAAFETQYRDIQSEVTRIKTLLVGQTKPLEILKLMSSVIPSDVYFKSYDYTPSRISVQAVAKSTQGFAVFLNNLTAVKEFIRVDMGEVKKNPTEGILFMFQIYLTPEKAPKKEIPGSPVDTNSNTSL